jgi:fibronectin-binding autotransporter adhesin
MGLTKPRAAQIFNLDYKQSTRVVTATNINLSGGAPSLVDGVTLSLGDRVLVTGQTTGTQNGLYYITTLGSGANGTWARTSDGNENGEIEAGMIVMVTEGAIYADTQWKLITDDPIIINTTALTFTQNYLANSISSGTSNVVVNSNANVTISSAGTANVISVSNTAVTFTGNLFPSANVTYSLGNTALRWKDLWLSNSTLYIGDVSVATTGSTLTVNGANVLTGNAGAAFSTSGNITGGNILTSGQISATGNVTANYFLGNVACASGIFSSRIFNGTSEANIGASGGNVNVSVGGTSNVAVFATTGQFITGLLSVTGNITGGNISATNHTGTNVSVTGTATAASTVGGVITGSSASVTGTQTAASTVGGVITGSSTSVTGNITGANLTTAGNISATGNIAGNYLLANIYFATGFSASRIFNGTSEANIGTSGGNANISIGGVSNVVVFSTTGEFLTGLLSVTGNITGGNISATNHTGTNVSVTGTVTSASVAGGVITGTSTSVSGGVTANSVSATSNGAGTNFRVGDDVWIGDISIADTMSIRGQQSALNGYIVFGNADSTALGRAGSGPLTYGGAFSASGNVTGGNILTAGLASVTGNISGANLVVTTNIYDATAMNIVTGAGNINLQPAGNVVVNSKNINGLAQPVQNQDAATKLYVDNAVSTAISYHQPVVAATTTTLATTTGGTVTYSQPNGAGNGVGALLTTTGLFNLIDTANVQTIGTRILVKNEANAVFNGVYTWANATNIVRATDADTAGTGNTNALGLNDYFFVSLGNVNLGSAYIVSAPTTAIVFGTSNIAFAQFSQSQVYSANTLAGINLAGTVINAKVDNTTTAFDGGGNISVKASAVLTTPNIGAATGTSLSVAGGVTAASVAGGAITGTSTSVTGTQTAASTVGGVITGSSSSVTGTQTAASTVGGVITGTSASVSGGVTAASVSGGVITGSSSSVTGTQTAASTVGGVITGSSSSVTGTQTAASTVGGVITGSSASVTGTVTGASVVGGIITGTSVSVTGNTTAGNVLTGGLISATGNITGGNILGNGRALSGINAFSNVTVTGGNSAVADSIADTLTLTAGTGISIVIDPTTDTITIGAQGGSELFVDGADFGTVTEPVTVSEDLGLVTAAVDSEADLGALVTSGLIYPDQFVLPSYTTSTLPSASIAGSMIYVTNETGGPVPAFADGTNWRRVTDRAIVT